MGSRTPGKKPDGKEGAVSVPPRLLRPRGMCFRCHLPAVTSCVCSPQERKLRVPSTPVSSENVSHLPAAVRKKKLPSQHIGTVRARETPIPSRRQLFKGTSPETDSSSSLLSAPVMVSQEISTPDIICLDPSPSSAEANCSSHVREVEHAIPSTSSEPTPSTSALDSQPVKSKKRKKKSKLLTRHSCRVCSKVFGSPGKLGQHMFSHTGEKPFECEKCMKAFSSKFKLVRHLLIHSDERQYCCGMCDRTFHRKDHLKNHLKVHSPVKKTYRCDKNGCHKVYSSLLSYRKHAAVHSAEDGDLECKMCGKVFVTKEEIVYHLKVHAGSRTVKNAADKKYWCEFCERRFFTRKDVRRHLVVHTGKRDFLCQFCPQRFGRKDHLVRHIKKSHSNVPGVNAKKQIKQLRAVSSLEYAAAVSHSSAGPNVASGKHQDSVQFTDHTGTIESSEVHHDVRSDLECHESMSDALVIVEDSSVANDSKQIPLKQEQIFSDLKVESLMNPSSDANSITTSAVKVEDYSLMPSIIYTQPPPPYPDHLTTTSVSVDQVDTAVKSETSLTPLPVGMESNQFVTAMMSCASGSGSLSSELHNQQQQLQQQQTQPQQQSQHHQPGVEGSVSTSASAQSAMSEVEASEFLVHFQNEELLQLIELTIPPTSSTSNGDMNTHSAPLPRFNQAFQQQPPP